MNRWLLFGYVITNNNTGRDKGFWSPFPCLVVWVSDLYYKHVSFLDSHGNMRYRWDFWTFREEIEYRQSEDYVK